MLYEELLEMVTARRMLVTCCFDEHCTAFQALGDLSGIFYDPLKSWLVHVSGTESYRRLLLFLLLKCGYGDSQHIQDNKSYYTGPDSNPTRRMVYSLWRDINKVPMVSVRSDQCSINLSRYLLVNNSRDPRMVSTQQTGNTCYFQTYLFGVLCKVGNVALGGDGRSVDVRAAEKLEETAVRISQCLLGWFVDGQEDVMRPLSNSNLVLDFHRYKDARYFGVMTSFLRSLDLPLPDYQSQFADLLKYYESTKTLHMCAAVGVPP